MRNLCICLPSKCYAAGCDWCANHECVEGDEIIFGHRISAGALLLAAAFSPYVLFAIGALAWLVTR